MFGNWLRTSPLMAAIVAVLGGGQGLVLAAGLRGANAGLFSTHPDTGERIARLRARVRGAGAD